MGPLKKKKNKAHQLQAWTTNCTVHLQVYFMIQSKTSILSFPAGLDDRR